MKKETVIRKIDELEEQIYPDTTPSQMVGMLRSIRELVNKVTA